MPAPLVAIGSQREQRIAKAVQQSAGHRSRGHRADVGVGVSWADRHPLEQDRNQSDVPAWQSDRQVEQDIACIDPRVAQDQPFPDLRHVPVRRRGWHRAGQNEIGDRKNHVEHGHRPPDDPKFDLAIVPPMPCQAGRKTCTGRRAGNRGGHAHKASPAPSEGVGAIDVALSAVRPIALITATNITIVHAT